MYLSCLAPYLPSLTAGSQSLQLLVSFPLGARFVEILAQHPATRASLSVRGYITYPYGHFNPGSFHALSGSWYPLLPHDLVPHHCTRRLDRGCQQRSKHFARFPSVPSIQQPHSFTWTCVEGHQRCRRFKPTHSNTFVNPCAACCVCKGTSRQWPSGDGSGDEANV